MTLCPYCRSSAREAAVDKHGNNQMAGDCGTTWWPNEDPCRSHECEIIAELRDALVDVMQQVDDQQAMPDDSHRRKYAHLAR